MGMIEGKHTYTPHIKMYSAGTSEYEPYRFFYDSMNGKNRKENNSSEKQTVQQKSGTFSKNYQAVSNYLATQQFVMGIVNANPEPKINVADKQNQFEKLNRRGKSRGIIKRIAVPISRFFNWCKFSILKIK